MLNTSEALERQICHIHELLERSHGNVTWNDHIRDPDNPSQLRQIDITVRRDGELTIIECRLSRRRQDVKWIEELHGRRQSLGAQAVIAIASAGFTTGARKKAARFGVCLRDLQWLTDEEITSWGGQVTVLLYYYQYSDVNLFIGFSSQSIQRLEPEGLSQELRSHDIVQAAFNAAAKQLGALNLASEDSSQTTRFCIRARPEGDVRLGGQQILELGIEGNACLVALPVVSPKVFKYGEPEQSIIQREITVQQFTLGESSIVHHNAQIAMNIDLAALELPPLSQVRYIRTTSGEMLEHESFGITNPQKLRVVGPMKAHFYECRS
jgi:hypothetical protein